VESIEETGDGVRVTVSKVADPGSAGGSQTSVIEADKVLQAIGFQPRVDGYGLEKTGVALTERGAIDVDGRLRTNVPHIFAIGVVKILSDQKYGEILGAHLIGPEVTELLPELTLAQQWDLTVTEVARNIHAHPTLGEAVKEAVHGLAGHMINM